MGGLLAVLGTQGAAELVKEFPFATVTSAFVFDLKLMLLLGDICLCVFSFFMVNAPVHVWRAVDRFNARGQGF